MNSNNPTFTPATINPVKSHNMQPVYLPLEDRDTVAERLSTQVEQIKVAMKKNDDREI